MKHILKGAICLMLGGLLGSSAVAQSDYPNKPIRLLVPFGAGGGTDLAARAIADKVGQQMGQKMLVDNKPGANSNIGSAMVAQAPADGYTVLYNTSAVILNSFLMRNVPFDVFRDFAPVSLTAAIPELLVVPTSMPVTNLAQTIEYMRTNGKKLNYASVGIGNITHLSMLLFLGASKMDINHLEHVPYNGGTGTIVPDIIEGRTHFYFSSVTFALPFIKSNRMRAVAVTSLTRSDRLPDIPTMSESGLPGFEVIIWQGTLVPAKTPPAIVSRLNGEIQKALKAPDLVSHFGTLGLIPLGSSTKEYADYLKKEADRWGRVIREAKIPSSD